MPMLRDVWHGVDVCLFAYGGAGSGKTYSLLGRPLSWEASKRAAGPHEGVLPRFLRSLFLLGEWCMWRRFLCSLWCLSGVLHVASLPEQSVAAG